MKISGRSLKRRVQLLGNRLSRIKHHNGHGVHSPFVYGFVRKVLMAKSLQEGSGSALFEALRGVGLSEKRARELHNAMCYAEAQSFAVNSVDADFVVYTREQSIEALRSGYAETKSKGAIFVVSHPYDSRERQVAVREMIDNHRSTTIDNRAYTIFFNNRLPKQHYRL